MIKLKRSFRKTLSMTLILMIIFSVLSPLSSIRADARDIVVHTPTQDIDNFSVSLISSITNQGSYDDPKYVVTPTQNGSEVRYQVDYSLSGSFDIAAGNISITVPKHIFKDRSGKYADEYELAIPEASEVDPDDKENEFVYIERENDILIYNRLEISAADSGSIQFSYKTTKSPFEYVDMSVSDTVTATMEIAKSTDEQLYTYDTAPAITLNTYARLQSTEKSISIGAPMSRNNSWGNAADFGIDDPSKYYYLVWTVQTDISATQPYTLSFDDTVTGDYGDTAFVGLNWDGSSKYSSDLTSPVRKTNGKSYFYVLTRHLKSTYEPYETYRIYNKVNAALHPFDEVDPDTQKSSSAIYTYSQPKPEYPIGHFNYWKYNHLGKPYNSGVVNYQLGEFRNHEIEEIERNMD